MADGREWSVDDRRYWWPESAASRLRKLISDGRCIAFLGSGPSIGAGYPDWYALLRELCAATGVLCPEPLELSPVETLLALADSCQQASNTKYCEVLSSRFACQPPDIPDAVRYLARLHFKSYVTTTFDPLLHQALEDETDRRCAGVFRFPILPTSFEIPYLFHIHGKIEIGTAPDPSNIILGTDGFKRAYDGENSLLWGFLLQLLSFHSCCFVGCGLKEPEFQTLFGVCGRLREKAKTLVGAGDPPEHFALFPENLPESTLSFEKYGQAHQQEEKAARDAQLAEILGRAGITVIRYKVIDSQHIGLKKFLRDCVNTSPIELRIYPRSVIE